VKKKCKGSYEVAEGGEAEVGVEEMGGVGGGKRISKKQKKKEVGEGRGYQSGKGKIENTQMSNGAKRGKEENGCIRTRGEGIEGGVGGEKRIEELKKMGG